MISCLQVFLRNKSRDRLIFGLFSQVNAFLCNKYPFNRLRQFFIYYSFLTLIFMKPLFQGYWTLVGF